MTAVLAIIAVVGIGYVLLLAFPNPDASADARVQKIARAIATAEGFYSPQSRAARNHNPGDMTQDLIGKAVGTDGPFVIYATDNDGWLDLYAQINLWLSGASNFADPSSTISDLSDFYTTDSPPGAQATWAVNVANALGVPVDTPLAQIA